MPLMVGSTGKWYESGSPLGAATCPACRKNSLYYLYAKSRDVGVLFFGYRRLAEWDTGDAMLACANCKSGWKVASLEEALDLFDHLQFSEWDYYLEQCIQRDRAKRAQDSTLSYLAAYTSPDVRESTDGFAGRVEHTFLVLRLAREAGCPVEVAKDRLERYHAWRGESDPTR